MRQSAGGASPSSPAPVEEARLRAVSPAMTITALPVPLMTAAGVVTSLHTEDIG
ncbi:hypothetical protein [Streptomyces sp. NPDC090445]|uniref:hypothetical protein n=1 Tax=Streptomyces sp. NPDC090445 TaxID=3365963 RepID=UPI0037FCA29D